NCLCDRLLTFNVPASDDIKIIELYINGKLFDKRSIKNMILSDGSEFCESELGYKEICYRRLAFTKLDPYFCSKISDKNCLNEFEEFVTLKCLAKHLANCKEFFYIKE
ncbi:MAG: hypothetical protein QXM75_04595, partial [Candidatus Diapherotrites archaeon]